jgi:hypothetical protein
MWKSPLLKGDASLSGTFSSRKNRNLARWVVNIMMFCADERIFVHYHAYHCITKSLLLLGLAVLAA